MKKIIITLCIAMCAPGIASAQSIYKALVDEATAKSIDSKEDNAENQFIVDAMKYINTHAKVDKSKNQYFFDAQAVNISSFVNDFKSSMAKAGPKRAAILKAYQEAVAASPLIADADPTEANKYVKDGSLTPFSLNCDWEQAYDLVTKKLRQMLK